MKPIWIFLLISVLFIHEGVAGDDKADRCPLIRGEGQPLAELNTCDRLAYGLYANQDQDNAVHRLPDFSFAGYRGGGVVLPMASVVVTLQPGSGDDTARIQAAIDKVADLPVNDEGRRGAVFLKTGIYHVSNTLYIRTSGVVLRGEGQGENGTVLVFTRRQKDDLLVVEGRGDKFPRASAASRIITSYLPVGSVKIEVESTDGFKVGDRIGILRTPNQFWIVDLNMGQWGWKPEDYRIHQERRITGIGNRTIFIDVPTVDTIEYQYGGGEVFLADLSGRLSEVGVEDLRLVSEYDGDEDESHGWNAIVFDRVENSWVRRVTVKHFAYSVVRIRNSSYNTVEESAMLDPVSIVDGGRRYSFVVTGGTSNLFQRCYSAHARHDFVVQARLTGPNVWLDSYSHQSYSDQGPHHRWSAGSLFDNIRANYLHVENRQNSGTGHGWAGAQTLFWNSTASGFRVFAPRGAMNWTVGGVGNPQEGMWAQNEAQGWWESHGKPVRTRSLYLQQLQDRLGETAVQNITTAAQRKGRIWNQLAAWAGEGRLADFSNGDDKEWPNQLSIKFRYYYNNGNMTSSLRDVLGSPRRASVFSMARGGIYHTLRTENTDHPAGTIRHYISKDGIDYTPVSGEPLFNAQKAVVFSDGRPRHYQRIGQPSVVLDGNDEVIAILVAALPVKEDGRGPDKIVTEEILIFPVFTLQ